MSNFLAYETLEKHKNWREHVQRQGEWLLSVFTASEPKLGNVLDMYVKVILGYPRWIVDLRVFISKFKSINVVFEWTYSDKYRHYVSPESNQGRHMETGWTAKTHQGKLLRVQESTAAAAAMLYKLPDFILYLGESPQGRLLQKKGWKWEKAAWWWIYRKAS